MKKPEEQVVDGCRNCPWGGLAASSYGPQLCQLHRGVLDIALALTWKGGLADTLGGGEEYPKECPLLTGRPRLLVLRDTRHKTEKIGRPVKGHRGHGDRNIEKEAWHLKQCWRAANDALSEPLPLVKNVAGLAKEHKLNASHLRAAIRGSRPWHLKEVDAVAGHCAEAWGYDKLAEPADYSLKAKLARAGE